MTSLRRRPVLRNGRSVCGRLGSEPSLKTAAPAREQSIPSTRSGRRPARYAPIWRYPHRDGPTFWGR